MNDRASKFAGMKVNERLFAAGLLDRYREAAENQDAEALQEVLAEVGLRIDAAGNHWELDGNTRVED